MSPVYREAPIVKIAMVEERDHKRFLVNAGEDLAEEIWELMNADGYRFACSPSLPNGQRAVYFTRERPPVPRM